MSELLTQLLHTPVLREVAFVVALLAPAVAAVATDWALRRRTPSTR